MNIQTFVNDALSLINVLPSGLDASAEDAELALRVVSDLADEWMDDGIMVSWSPSASTGDECPLQGLEKTAVQYHLAIRLCPHFGREPSPTLIALAVSSFAKLQRSVLARSTDPIELSMPAEEGSSGFEDITS